MERVNKQLCLVSHSSLAHEIWDIHHFRQQTSLENAFKAQIQSHWAKAVNLHERTNSEEVTALLTRKSNQISPGKNEAIKYLCASNS